MIFFMIINLRLFHNEKNIIFNKRHFVKSFLKYFNISLFNDHAIIRSIFDIIEKSGIITISNYDFDLNNG